MPWIQSYLFRWKKPWVRWISMNRDGYFLNLNLTYRPEEIIDVTAIIEEHMGGWFNQSLCWVNESVVRVGIAQGEFRWHKHTDTNEFFFVVGHALYLGSSGRKLHSHCIVTKILVVTGSSSKPYVSNELNQPKSHEITPCTQEFSGQIGAKLTIYQSLSGEFRQAGKIKRRTLQMRG